MSEVHKKTAVNDGQLSASEGEDFSLLIVRKSDKIFGFPHFFRK